MKSPTSIVNTLLEADYDPNLDPLSDPKNFSYSLGYAHVSREDTLGADGWAWLSTLNHLGLLPGYRYNPHLPQDLKNFVDSIDKIYVELSSFSDPNHTELYADVLTCDARARLKSSLGPADPLHGYWIVNVVNVTCK